MIKKITLLLTLLATITSAYATKSTQAQNSPSLAAKAGLVVASVGSVAITGLTLGKCGLETVYNYCLSQQVEIPYAHAFTAPLIGAKTPCQLALLRQSWTFGTTLLVTLGCIQVLKTTYEAFNEKSPKSEDPAH